MCYENTALLQCPSAHKHIAQQNTVKVCFNLKRQTETDIKIQNIKSMNINSTHFCIYLNTSVSLLDMIPLVHVLIFKSLVPALAHFTQQVLIEYLEMRHPLSPVLASLTVITLFPFIAIHLLLCFSWWLCRKLLDTLKNYPVISIVVDHTVHMRSLYCTVRGAVLCDAYFEFFLKSKRHFDKINPVKQKIFFL